MNRSQPDRAQKRARAGQTYYPPTVEDDPTAQGDVKPGATTRMEEMEEPSPKRQKDFHGNPKTPEKSPQKSQVSNTQAPSSSKASVGFTPINAPRPPLSASTESALRLADSQIDEELPYNAQSKLRAIFLSGDKFISQNTLRSANDVLGKLEREPLIPNGLLEDSMIEKTLKEILALERVPGDHAFHFKTRFEKLLKMWKGWTAVENVWAPTAQESSVRFEKAKQKKPQSPARQEAVAASIQARPGGTPGDDSLNAPPLDPRLSTSPKPGSEPSKAKDKGKQKATERISEAISPEKLDIMDFVEDNADLLKDIYTNLGVDESISKGSSPSKKVEASPTAKTTAKTAPRLSAKPSSGPKGILKSPKKTPKKLSSSGSSSSKSAPATPQHRATTVIDLATSESSNGGSSPSGGLGKDPSSSTAAATPSASKDLPESLSREDDPAELLDRRRRDLRKKQDDVQMELELTEDVERELDSVTKRISELKEKLADAENQRGQISMRMKEIMGLV